ncbi:MerR family transcriptional regulator [Aeromicrobium phragmitis]|uniref:MerR family transcriptional regulator n=1 Tax=Aeromicrobium phragmitis TaxID=2478914 RepID=UPI001AA06B78|nr:MerR family transcriptional regulator [Aeromicrobium phragmitis]
MAEPVSAALSTASVSAATGYSAQQIRDLEAIGVISPALRANNGYRRFTQHHVRDLRAYRDLTRAIGPVPARRAMRDIRRLDPDAAAALVRSFHALLDAERERALAARRALRSISDEAGYEAPATTEDAMTITELALALDVRPSTLRFWEKCGLVQPDRVATTSGSARRYAVAAVREARITAALREAGYRIPDVQRALDAIRDLDGIDASLDALDARIRDITQRTLALLKAGCVMAVIIESGRADDAGSASVPVPSGG